MATVGFEEKQYENAANLELGVHHPAIFPPGQVLEAVVGYDVAAHQPADAPIWKLVGQRAPPGVFLISSFWQGARLRPKAADLPSHYVSLILQYKRPEYLHRSNATQWPFWLGPYFRFAVSEAQHSTLCRLSGNLCERAVTAYASPAFRHYRQLEHHQMNRTILATSNFIDPCVIGKHKIWTYADAGTTGKANPNGEPLRSLSFGNLWLLASERGRKENLFEHLRGLASAINVSALDITSDTPEWIASLHNLGLQQVQFQAVFDVVELGQLVGESGSSWFVVDFDV